MKTEKTIQTATFAAGCFWHIEEAFRRTKGVVRTIVGYTGGDFDNPTYEDVCSGRTGHAEAVRVEFDPKKISFEQLLEIFWRMHDPTQKNRQGPDIGTNYRSAVFYHNEAQKKAALASMKKEQKKYAKPIVTEIVKAGRFWPSEEYHQKYLMKRKKSVC